MIHVPHPEPDVCGILPSLMEYWIKFEELMGVCINIGCCGFFLSQEEYRIYVDAAREMMGHLHKYRTPEECLVAHEESLIIQRSVPTGGYMLVNLARHNQTPYVASNFPSGIRMVLSVQDFAALFEKLTAILSLLGS